MRLWAALQWRMNFDSDEAIFALMARHILGGQFSPLLYGTNHIGSLESVLSAIPMSVLGQSVPVFRSSTLLLMVLFMAIQSLYVWRRWGGRSAFITSLFIALPGFHILEWSFQPIDALGALLSCGLGVILLSDRIPLGDRQRIVRLFVLGVLGGVGLWSNQMMVIFLIAAFIPQFLGSSEWKHLYSSFDNLSTRRLGVPLLSICSFDPYCGGPSGRRQFLYLELLAGLAIRAHSGGSQNWPGLGGSFMLESIPVAFQENYETCFRGAYIGRWADGRVLSAWGLLAFWKGAPRKYRSQFMPNWHSTKGGASHS